MGQVRWLGGRDGGLGHDQFVFVGGQAAKGALASAAVVGAFTAERLRPPEPTVRAVAGRVGLCGRGSDVPGLVHADQDLAATGMATFEHNPDHKSSPLLCLTPAGRRALERINTAAAGSNQALAEQLSERDIDKLRRLLTQLTSAIQELIDTKR